MKILQNMLTVILLNVIQMDVLNVFCSMQILLNAIPLNVILLNENFGECHSAENYSDNLILLEIILINENSCKRHSAERHSAKRHSAERHAGKCCGTRVDLDFSASTFILFQ
jgi:hypothetical protein